MSTLQNVETMPIRVKQTVMELDEDVGRIALKRRASNFDEDEIEDLVLPAHWGRVRLGEYEVQLDLDQSWEKDAGAL